MDEKTSRRRGEVRTVVVEGSGSEGLVDGDDGGVAEGGPGLDCGECGLVDETIVCGEGERVKRREKETHSRHA